MLANGRCAQDSYYLAEVNKDVLPDKFKERYNKKIQDIVPLGDNKLLVFFKDGKTKKCDIANIVKDNRFFIPVLKSPNIFNTVSIQVGGYGISWSDRAEISDSALYKLGEDIPLSIDDFISFVSNRVVSSTEAAQLIGCTRQNITELAKHGRLHPVKTDQKSTLFLKSEILIRNWD